MRCVSYVSAIMSQELEKRDPLTTIILDAMKQSIPRKFSLMFYIEKIQVHTVQSFIQSNCWFGLLTCVLCVVRLFAYSLCELWMFTMFCAAC